MDAIMEKARLHSWSLTVRLTPSTTWARQHTCDTNRRAKRSAWREDAIDAPTYTAIINALSIAFGEQFTPEELAESDTDVADVIVAYMAVDLNLAQRIEQKIDAMTANFKTGS